jgi:NAD(P)-dependent dehydrogenase (short-subunit alcohol dehydrogenase family)
MGARVVITARDECRGRLALRDIRELSGRDDVEVMPLDLSRFASVGELAAKFAERFDRLDVLINNAGITVKSRHETEDGNEMTLQVNHLGHFMLTHLLCGMLVAGGPSRVVNITSSAHKSARRADLDDLQSSIRYTAHSAYAKSKLATILFARELARRWDGKGVSAFAVHPGIVKTGFRGGGSLGLLGSIAFGLIRPFAMSSEEGARGPVYVASAPDLDRCSVRYWVKSVPGSSSAVAQDDDAARRLWEMSEQLVGL